MRRDSFLGVVLALCTIAAPAALGQEPPEQEFGLLLGAAFPSHKLTGLPQTLDRDSLLLGVRAATEVQNDIDIFGDLTWARLNQGVVRSIDTNEYALRVGPEFLFGRRAQFFLAPAVGWGFFNLSKGSSFNRALGSFGIGQRILAASSDSWRWEVRAERAFGGGNSGAKDFTNAEVLLGYSFGRPPRDSDGDGVPDKRDKCPNTPKGAIVDADGCPKDSDGDGVPDGIDRCPDTPKGAIVDQYGCPKDSDGDGVPDGIDRCPDTPKGAIVDEHGCPKDSDGDGVPDGIDRCPDTPKGVIVDEHGCPKDSDGDGVPDGIDRCPDTPRGAKVDAHGCPEAPKAAPLFEPGQKALVLEGVSFDSDKATLLPASQVVLDRVAASLAAWPDVRVEVAGFTDSTNTVKHNAKLSQRRAEAVRDYLTSKGVAPGRLVAKGYGESNPIADNKTKEGRAKNRRVELRRLS
ncbi:MAG TPA: OmpA family protein [Thermoanaerobaculaceae bacterium]|nr:OmpA family protein [Thermoanaerobaculaceae bacterium]